MPQPLRRWVPLDKKRLWMQEIDSIGDLTLKKDLLHAREPKQKKEGDRIHLHVRKEARPEDAASRPEGNRGTTIQDHTDRQPLEKKREAPHASYQYPDSCHLIKPGKLEPCHQTPKKVNYGSPLHEKLLTLSLRGGFPS